MLGLRNSYLLLVEGVNRETKLLVAWLDRCYSLPGGVRTVLIPSDRLTVHTIERVRSGIRDLTRRAIPLVTPSGFAPSMMDGVPEDYLVQGRWLYRPNALTVWFSASNYGKDSWGANVPVWTSRFPGFNEIERTLRDQGVVLPRD